MNSIFERNYKIIENAPATIEWSKYYSQVMDEYQNLLEKSCDSEKSFQVFFERNPSFIPGGLQLMGNTSHYPYMDTLISQPEIGIRYTRKPDFLWLAEDSLRFTPVFIEIEKPNKKMFTQSGTPSADFTQAKNQIDEWKYLLSQPDNIRAFYTQFSIPLDMQAKRFSPQYLLIYGRRGEYQGNDMWTGVRASIETNDFALMSYDRLAPIADYMQFTTCKVSNGEYTILHIPPTFKYRPDCIDTLQKYKGFYEAIPRMDKTSQERKQFLRDRYSYWIDNSTFIKKGLIISMEGE